MSERQANVVIGAFLLCILAGFSATVTGIITSSMPAVVGGGVLIYLGKFIFDAPGFPLS